MKFIFSSTSFLLFLCAIYPPLTKVNASTISNSHEKYLSKETTDERVSTNHPACAEDEILAGCKTTSADRCLAVSKTQSSCDSACASYPFEDAPRPLCERKGVSCRTKNGRRGYTLRCCRRCEPGTNTVGGDGIGSTNLNDGITGGILPGIG